eukprot:scaffold16791_cov151-Isochrysis_galbana.AAC.1
MRCPGRHRAEPTTGSGGPRAGPHRPPGPLQMFGASLAPRGICRPNATGRRASCPLYPGPRALKNQAESGLRLSVGVCAAYMSLIRLCSVPPSVS